MEDTSKLHRRNDWTSIHYYLASNGYTIMKYSDPEAQPHSKEAVKHVEGWTIIEVRSDDDVPEDYRVSYIAEAKVSGSLTYNSDTGKIVNASQALYSHFRFYPTFKGEDTEASVMNLADFSSFSNRAAYFGCTFLISYTTDYDTETHYLLDSGGSAYLRLVIEDYPG